MVVVGGHRAAVGTGGGYGEQVPRADVAGQEALLSDANLAANQAEQQAATARAAAAAASERVADIRSQLRDVAMQAYVVAGLWTDTYLLWAGLLVTVLVLAGVVLFPAIFWIWMAVCGGGTLIATGFYVRHGWRSRDA